jgi:hypothetical protein
MCATDPQRACTAKILITRNEFISTQNPNLWRRNQPDTETDTEREKERKLAELATQVHNQILSATLKN